MQQAGKQTASNVGNRMARGSEKGDEDEGQTTKSHNACDGTHAASICQASEVKD